MIGSTTTASRAGPLVITTSRYYSFLLAVFVVCTMTTLNVLAPRRAYLSALETGDGDLGRQIGYLVLLAAAVIPICSPVREGWSRPFRSVSWRCCCGGE